MEDFALGPFEYRAGQRVTLAGRPSVEWSLRYGSERLAQHYVDADASRTAVREAFVDDVAAFVRRHRPTAARRRASPDLPNLVVELVESTDRVGCRGRVLGTFVAAAEIAGLSSGLIDDRYPTWLVTASAPAMCVPVGVEEFQRLQVAHNAIHAARAAAAPAPAPAARHAWVTKLLPEEVLTTDPETWRAPTAWELRHVVGEDSFVGVTGAAAAALVGVTPQGFRKYTAREGAANRQSISFAMWHLLLHRLGVQRLEEAGLN